MRLDEILAPKSQEQQNSHETCFIEVCLRYVALVFSLKLAYDLKLGKSTRTTLTMVLEG